VDWVLERVMELAVDGTALALFGWCWEAWKAQHKGAERLQPAT